MGKPPVERKHQDTLAEPRWRVELHLTVWSADDGWHARLAGPGASPREFVSPFELARFVSWPVAELTENKGTGLR